MSQTIVGTSAVRIEGREKVTGGLRYAGDLRLPGMLHARLVFSPHAHARVLGIDTAAARALPGVVDVVSGADLVAALPTVADAMLLALDRVRYYGQPVAAVLGETPAAAEDGAQAVRVEYVDLPAVLDPVAAMRPGAPLVRDRPAVADDTEDGMHATVLAEDSAGSEQREDLSPNVVQTVRFAQGDPVAGFAAAVHTVERTFRTHRIHQSYLEPHICVAAVDPVGEIQIWTSAQSIFHVRSATARALGRADTDVRLTVMPVGGGFGGKFLFLQPLTAALALRTGRPVRLELDRVADLLIAKSMPESVIELKLGAAADGTLTAIQARVVFEGGASGGSPVSLACLVLGSYYRCPHYLIEGYEVLTHQPPPGAYRAPGGPQGAFALETCIDELASRLGADRIDFRLQNCARAGELLPNGQRWPRIGLEPCLERLREHPTYRAWQASRGEHEGVGLAIGGWLMAIEPSAASCMLNADGTLNVLVGSVDLTGTTTGFAQLAAEVFGMPMERIRITTGDSQTAPFAGGTGGSKITYTVGPSVMEAVAEAKQQLLAIAADILEAAPGDLEIVSPAGGAPEVRVRGVPRSGRTLAEIAATAMRPGSKYQPVVGRGRTAHAEQAPGFGVHVVRVRVDPGTGQVTLLGYLAIHDIGFAINPAEVEGQIHGGVAQGVGWGLLEAMVYDEDGRLLTASFVDYAMPRADHLPPIEVELVEQPSPLGPFGARGIGEPPIIPGAAAIANAIADATGRRLTDLPMTPARVRGT